MRFRKIMQRTIIYSLSLLCLWLSLAQCFVMRNRWSDDKAYRVFKAKNVPLSISDTIMNDRHLHYAVSGSDSLPTLVFIHGSPGSWMNYMIFMWDSSLQKKFRMVAIDRPGFGYSDFGKAVHLQEQAALIMPVLQKLKTHQPMYLVGHSMGGPILVKLAADNSSLFEKIVIVAGSIDVNQEKTETWRTVMKDRPLYWLLPGAFGPSNTEILYLKKDLLALQHDFKNITSHVLFVHGDKDTWVPIGNIGYGQQMMINAKSITADTLFGAGHNIPWERTAAFKKILLGLY